MTNDRNNHFKYQLNINRDKFPELCEKLEYTKDKVGGIAWYLRSLVERDIQENGLYGFKFNDISIDDEQTKHFTRKEAKPVAEVTKPTEEIEETVVEESEAVVEEKTEEPVAESKEQTEDGDGVKKIKGINGIAF